GARSSSRVRSWRLRTSSSRTSRTTRTRSSSAPTPGIDRRDGPRGNKTVSSLSFGYRGGDGGGGLLEGDPLREVPEDHDVPDALDPAVRDGDRVAALHQEGVRLPDEDPVDGTVLDVHDQIGPFPQAHTPSSVPL